MNSSTEINLIVKGYTGAGDPWPIFIGHSFENPKKVIINESDTSEHRIWWGMEKGKTYNITLTYEEDIYSYAHLSLIHI